MTLDEFNALDAQAAHSALELCCVSDAWIDGMLALRPFSSAAELHAAADSVWARLGPEDYRQAFAGHPKIGDVKSLQARYARSGGLAASEQAGVAQADKDTIRRLAQGNADYEARFGYIFIVCATGKSAQDMCELLAARLANAPDDELRIAAEEQRRILQLRLEKML